MRSYSICSFIKRLIFFPLMVKCYFTSFSAQASKSDIETYTFQNFPKDIVALHMPCKESNMFATNCACHIRCTDAVCGNAKDICMSYRKSKNCRYMLIRGYKNKIATLKREPTDEEAELFNIDKYPKNFTALKSGHWEKMYSAHQEMRTTLPTDERTPITYSPSKSFEKMIDSLGQEGQLLMERILEPHKYSPSNKKHCGNKYYRMANSSTSTISAAKDNFLRSSISLVALSYHAPRTLLNSMRSWKKSGLLDLVSEKILLLNDPVAEEFAIALEFGFRIISPKDIPNSKMSKPNVLTIGASFYYALQLISSEYLLFLENDFKMDVESSLDNTKKELLTGAAMLDSGVEIVRLNSRKYQGCGTFKDCNHHGINLASQNPRERMRNWFAFYCKDKSNTNGSVSDCFEGPDYRCFTSWDTNWTLNAVLVKKLRMLNKKYPLSASNSKSIAEIGLSQYDKQDGFETVMAHQLPWPQWRVPICISYNGLFIHEEIETST